MPPIEEFMAADSSSGKTLSLGLDERGHLYVNGAAVVTDQKVKLQWWVNFAVVLGALGAFAQGLVAVWSLYR